MVELGLVVAGGALGGVLAWLIARAQGRSAALAAREALQLRIAAAETLGDELRKQLSQRELELTELRAGLLAERTARTDAQSRAESTRENLEEQKRLLADARERLGETFKALSADALRANQTSFTQHAQDAIKPLHEALRRYDQQIQALEASRQHAYGGLEAQLRTLVASSNDLQRETGNLVTALRAPHVRGRWGEITLQRVVELAGMAKYCDYFEQVTAEGVAGRVRPDMVVRLPNGREIVVDAKVPLTAYLDALSAATDEERGSALIRHAQQIRQHMHDLAGKAYWEEFARAPEFVVMFIPGEAFVAAAAQADGSLIEDGMAKKVIVATPTTLIALLRAVAHGWRQEQIAAGAEKISELGRELYERLRAFVGHFEEVGDKLGKATTAFNRAIGSMESRVLPSARRFRDLGAAIGEDIPVLAAIETQPRQLVAAEVPRQLDVTDDPPPAA